MEVIIFEDNKSEDLFPLNMLRASFDIKCGTGSIKDRIVKILNGKHEISLVCRETISGLMKENNKEKVNQIPKDDTLFLNGRAVFGKDLLKKIIKEKKKDHIYTYKDEFISAYLPRDKAKEFKTFFNEAGSKDLNFKEYFESNKFTEFEIPESGDLFLLKYPWDAIKYFLQGGLSADLELYFQTNKDLKKANKSDFFKNNKNIRISPKSKIYPNTVLDASEGKIIIEENCTIEPFCFIKGPVFIGKNTLIKSGTRIYGPCSIGKNSKVAGEIAESIFHSYVNKQHDGFAGHSYICPFVNLGADTVTSDLKNNYSKIKMKIGETGTDTGMQFLGSILGDHTKTSINTMLNTGTVSGIFANIFGGGFPDKEIGSFTWNEGGNKPVRYQLQKAVETAVTVMSRRGINLSKSYENLITYYSKNSG
ncbi:MAG: hypothetical protein IPM96_13670 [Ignavibacteria bacterium]|nr:hypothetical protein [Ignavibacteria bacterium]